MSIKLSKLVDNIKPSFTLQMTARAAELRSKGVDVINFGVGEPDFNTPSHIIEAGQKAITDGYTKYTPGSGMLELKEAIKDKIRNMTGLSYDISQIIVSNGGKQSLSVACQALFDKGDKVVIFSPYWVSFPEFVTLSGATPVLVDTLPLIYQYGFNSPIYYSGKYVKSDNIDIVIANHISTVDFGIFLSIINHFD